MATKTIVTALLAMALLTLTTGCVNEYQLRSQKPNIHSITETRYQPDSYKVLGHVTAQGKGMTVLGFVFGEGLDGQGLLWEEAVDKYGDEVTGLKDVTSNSEWISVLGFIFARIETTYHAVAVHEG
jgi:hypothetical protein